MSVFDTAAAIHFLNNGFKTMCLFMLHLACTLAHKQVLLQNSASSEKV